LGPVVVGQYFTFQEYSSLLNNTLSKPIDYWEISNIAARIIIDQNSFSLFNYFNCYKSKVWFLILFSIIILSLVSSLREFHFYKALEYLWNYFILLFPNSIQKFALNSSQRLLLSVWLLSAFTLSLGFTSYILEYMVRAVPVLTIDSLEDIPKRPQMKVLLRGDSALAQYVKLIDSDIARAIKSKFITVFKPIFEF